MNSSPPLDFEGIDSPEFLESLKSGGAGGKAAFSRLVRAAHDRLSCFIRRQLSSRDECQQVLQEVYLAVHEGLPGFAGESKLTTWIFGLANRRILERSADRKPESEPPPEPLAPRNAVEALIGKAMESLPDESRRIYHLRDVEGLSGEEAAEVMGMPPEDARAQLHRARRHIVDWAREKLAEAGSIGKSGGEGGKA